VEREGGGGVGVLELKEQKVASTIVADADESLPPRKSKVEKIIELFTLNEKQQVALWAVADTLLQEIAAEENPHEKPPPQLLLYIGGPAGTGKSQVIKAIQALFDVFGKAPWVVTAAVVGTVAGRFGG